MFLFGSKQSKAPAFIKLSNPFLPRRLYGILIKKSSILLKIPFSFLISTILITASLPTFFNEDNEYLIEDAKYAVRRLAYNGVDVFCVGVESESNKNLSRIFGNKNYVIIKSASELPKKLPLIYLTLSRWKNVNTQNCLIIF